MKCSSFFAAWTHHCVSNVLRSWWRPWQITNERPLHASLKAISDVARGPDISIISPPQTQLPLRPASQTSTGFDTGPSRDVRVPRSEADQPGIMWLIVLASLLHCASSYQVDLQKLEGLAKAKVEVRQGFLRKRWSFFFIFSARLRSWTPVSFLPSIIVWINGFKCLRCLCMTDAWILHMHSHFSHLDTKM